MDKFKGIVALRRTIELILQKLNMYQETMNEISREELLEIMANNDLDLSWIASQESVDKLQKDVDMIKEYIDRQCSIEYGLLGPLHTDVIRNASLTTDKFIRINKVTKLTSSDTLQIYDMYPDAQGNKYNTIFAPNNDIWYNSNMQLNDPWNKGFTGRYIRFGDYVKLGTTVLNYTFADMTTLRGISFGKSIDTTNVTSMGRTFMNCSDLTILDLTNFDTHNVTNMVSMFEGCTSMTSIKVSRNKWVISEGCKTTNMFLNCGVDHVTYVD